MNPLIELNKMQTKNDSNSYNINILTNIINKLTKYHYTKSLNYKKILDGLNYNPDKFRSIEQLPFLPARLFKNFDLISMKETEIFKTIYSSGTTGAKTSKIYLDKLNASNQIKVLEKIIKSKIGNERLPMIVVDKNLQFSNNKEFNAKRAALSGFSIFAKNLIFLLNNNGEIDFLKLNNFLKGNKNKKFLIFGFTSNIFVNLYEKFSEDKIEQNLFSNAILIHGGGWKNLENKKINNKKFKNLISSKLGLQEENIINYYGLVEQTGSIFFECKCGYFLTTDYSHVLIRDKNFNIVKSGEKGFIQLISILPSSYPGHNILTEDIGEVVTDRNCNCGDITNTKFLVHGRVPKAELRGCSNFI